MFNTVALAVDTAPDSGGTTTCDTLWMGVPVITLRGTRSVSRSAASILATVGLSDWIAESPEDYVRLAVKYAGDRAVITERSEEHTSELQSRGHLVCRLLLE